jgi:hypothetical protein
MCTTSLLNEVLSLTSPDKPPAAKTERPADFYHRYSLDIEPLSATSLTFKMTKGEIIEGYLKVKGGNDDIRFYINDPSGARVLDVKRVQERHDFVYTANSDGSHSLNLTAFRLRQESMFVSTIE